MIGQVETVLVEGPSRNLGPGQDDPVDHQIRWSGRTSGNHIIHFTVPDRPTQNKQLLTGTFADIMIEEAFAHSLRGKMISAPMDEPSQKGERIIVA